MKFLTKTRPGDTREKTVSHYTVGGHETRAPDNTVLKRGDPCIAVLHVIHMACESHCIAMRLALYTGGSGDDDEDDDEAPTASRWLHARDVPMAHALLTTYLKRFALHCEYTLEEFRHWLFPLAGVIDSFVIPDPDDDTKLLGLCRYGTRTV